MSITICKREEDVRLLKVPAGEVERNEIASENVGPLAACLTTHLNFVNGEVTYGGNTYTIGDLAKWVAYQTYKSPKYGILPPAFILVHWGIELGWSVSSF